MYIYVCVHIHYVYVCLSVSVFMCVCDICVCMYECASVYLCVLYMYLCVNVYECVSLWVHACVCLHICVCLCVCESMFVCLCVSLCVCIWVSVCICDFPFFNFYLKTGSHTVAQADLKVMMASQSPECWVYRCVPPPWSVPRTSHLIQSEPLFNSNNITDSVTHILWTPNQDRDSSLLFLHPWLC